MALVLLTKEEIERKDYLVILLHELVKKEEEVKRELGKIIYKIEKL